MNAVSGTPTGKFPKTAHLLKRADFQRVYQQGRRHFSGNMTVFYLRSPKQREEASEVEASKLPRTGSRSASAETERQSCVRVGFTVPRALGKSVDRNRIRRRMREVVRHHLVLLEGAPAVDIVFNPKRAAKELEFEKLSEEVARAFEVVRKNTTRKQSERPVRREDRKSV